MLKGLVNVLVGFGLIVGEVVIVYDVMCKVVFVGLLVMGCIVVILVGKVFKFVVLELGGKFVNIVFVDVNLEVVCKGV